jgi:hypothetical protein
MLHRSGWRFTNDSRKMLLKKIDSYSIKSNLAKNDDNNNKTYTSQNMSYSTFFFSVCDSCRDKVMEELKSSTMTQVRHGKCDGSSTSHDRQMHIIHDLQVSTRVNTQLGWRFTNDSRRRLLRVIQRLKDFS